MVHGGNNQARRGRAFSLLELVLVITIISSLGAIAMPRYVNSLSNYRADQAARRVAADLTLARSEAWTAGQSRTVSFTQASATYQLTGVSGLDRPSSNYIVSLGADPYYASLYSVDFQGSQTVIFDGYGIPNHSGQIVVQAGTFKKTILLDIATGNVTIQ